MWIRNGWAAFGFLLLAACGSSGGGGGAPAGGGSAGSAGSGGTESGGAGGTETGGSGGGALSTTFGSPETLADHETNVFRIALVSDRVFFTSRGSEPNYAGGLRSVPKSGGNVATHHVGEVTALRASNGLVYFSDRTSEAIFSVDGEGANETNIVGGIGPAHDLTLGDGYVWWSSDVELGGIPLQRASLSQGSSEQLITTPDTRVYYLASNSSVLFMLAHSGASPVQLYRVAFDDLGGLEPTASNLSGGVVAQMALDDSYAYFAEMGPARVPLAGGDGETIAQLSGTSAIAVEPGAIYATLDASGECAPGAGSVVRIPLDTQLPQTLADGLDCPAGIAVDASGVYWANGGTRLQGLMLSDPESGKVMRVPRL